MYSTHKVIKVLKQDGTEEDFQIVKIMQSLKKAAKSILDLRIEYIDAISSNIAAIITLDIQNRSFRNDVKTDSDDIFNSIITSLRGQGYPDIANEYLSFREKRINYRKSKLGIK